MDEDTKHHARFRVSMRHIDIFGHVHNSVYFDYCQDAIVEFLENAKIYCHFRHRTSDLAYHVKKAEITFHSPIDVDDRVDARVRVVHLGTTSVAFEVELSRAVDQVCCATGRIVWVCVSLERGQPTPIPDDTRHALGSAS